MNLTRVKKYIAQWNHAKGRVQDHCWRNVSLSSGKFWDIFQFLSTQIKITSCDDSKKSNSSPSSPEESWEAWKESKSTRVNTERGTKKIERIKVFLCSQQSWREKFLCTCFDRKDLLIIYLGFCPVHEMRYIFRCRQRCRFFVLFTISPKVFVSREENIKRDKEKQIRWKMTKWKICFVIRWFQ